MDCGLPHRICDQPFAAEVENNLLAGALACEELRRIVFQDEEVVPDEVLLKGFGRVRDVKIGPDGAIYHCINRPELIVRLTPVSG